MQGEMGDKVRIQLTNEKLIGNGSFGVVFQATMVDTGEIVAVKKVLQDKRFKNRELQIMKQLRHPNIVELKNCFYTNGEKPEEVYLNLLLEFVPETIYRIIRHYSRSARQIPSILAKLYMYQVARSLAYIHDSKVCHRDIKPQNLLLDPTSHVVKLCDFGSAKKLVPGENNIAYICSRYYRAPELILGCTDYTTAIDTWSFGCVYAELLLCQPLFPGESNVDQLVEIIRIKGTPTKEEMLSMNHHLAEFTFPQIPDHTWNKVFRDRAGSDCIDLISKLIEYNPTKRLTPMQACAHYHFDDLRDPSTLLPDGRSLPTGIIFNFTPEEIRAAGDLYHSLKVTTSQPSNQLPYGVKPMVRQSQSQSSNQGQQRTVTDNLQSTKHPSKKTAEMSASPSQWTAASSEIGDQNPSFAHIQQQSEGNGEAYGQDEGNRGYFQADKKAAPTTAASYAGYQTIGFYAASQSPKMQHQDVMAHTFSDRWQQMPQMTESGSVQGQQTIGC